MEWTKKSWLVGRIAGVEIRLHISMLLIVLVAYYLFRPTDVMGAIESILWLVGILVCVFVHEAGHTLVAQIVGIKVNSIIIWPLGGVTNLSRPAEEPQHALLISAAGPLVNLLIAFGLWKLLSFSWYFYMLVETYLPEQGLAWADAGYRFVSLLAIMNGVLAVFNLLPLYPLDGGTLLRSALELLFGRSKANLVTFIIGIPVLLGVVLLGIFTRDYVLLAFCFLFALGIGSLNHQTSRWLNLGLAYLIKRPVYYHMREDFDLAIAEYTRAIERNPKDINLYLGRAGAYLNTLEKERGLADVMRALALDSNHPLAVEMRGEFYVMEKQYDAALEHYNRVLNLKPTWGIPHFDRASVFADQGEFPAALAELDMAVKYQPSVPIFHFLRSLVHYHLQDVDSARRDQEAALGLSQKEALVMQELNLDVYQGYLYWATDYYAWALEKLPNSWLVYQGRADANLVNEHYAQAIADYTRAMELAPREVRPYLGRGQAYQKSGQTELAAADYHQAATLADKSHLRRRAERLLAGL
jgi:Zn-dependent protease/Tfp pilus assembly protein PilF